MDTSGDLAVGILMGRYGDVAIFKNASGTGTVYTTPLDEEFFDGYDNQGNLFCRRLYRQPLGLRARRAPEGQHEIP